MKTLLIILTCIILAGCASHFPTPINAPIQNEASMNGVTLFTKTFDAHGGKNLADLRDVNVSLDGQWKQLIRRIQPLVTDYTYRVKSQERLLPVEGVYAAHYNGPAGTKSVFRSPTEIRVWYNGDESTDPAVLSSTALTADAFHLFLLGPLALSKWQEQFQRISDAKLNNKNYQRLYLKRVPGFGFSSEDEVVLWIDPESMLTKLIQITLEGHDTTQGAHVEVEYLDYTNVGNFVLPSQFFERVNAPISIDAHAWHLTGLDINRGWEQKDISAQQFSGDAADVAQPINKVK